MSQSGIKVAQEVVNEFNQLKQARKYRYVIAKLSDDLKEIILDSTAPSSSDPKADWENFRETLISAEWKPKVGPSGKGPRYAFFDFEFEGPSGGIRNKIIFVAWCPDDAPIKARMTSASSKDAIKKAVGGVPLEVQANDTSDIEFDEVLKYALANSK